MNNRFFRGVDISTLPDTLADGGRFYSEGKPCDVLALLANKGVDTIRLRVWNDPFDENGNAYGSGCDLVKLVSLAREITRRGFRFYLCIHYSDFWADPAKQFIPKAWRGLSLDELAREMEKFTLRVLRALKKAGCVPELVQIGNEITNGMLWPIGQLGGEHGARTNYDALAKLLRAGIGALKRGAPEARVMLHLENSCDNVAYRDWLDNIVSRGVEFDVLGVSYYPNWHGTLAELERNLRDVKDRYGKQVMIAETAYPFTDIPHIDAGAARHGVDILLEQLERFEFGISIEGQERFMRELFRLCGRLGLCGICYWEPAWLPTPNSTWATVQGRQYTGELDKPGGNEWSCQCLFDYEGNALPALDTFSTTL